MNLLKNITEIACTSGLKLIYLKKNDAPILSIQMWYKTGSKYERPGILGISHMVEHMMFRGSKNIKPEEHTRLINDVGGNCNAFTGEDITAYINNIPKQHLTMVLNLEHERMFNLTLDATIFETERKVIIEEYHRYMNSPVSKAMLEFRSLYFKDHPYQFTPLGTLDDISSMQVDQLRHYYDTWYQPANAVLVVVGDIDSSDELVDKVNQLFSPQTQNYSSFNKEKKITPLHIPLPSTTITRAVEFDVPLCIIGYPAPHSSQQACLPLDILQIIISQGETSRLYKSLVRNTSLAVMTGGINQFLQQAGMSIFFAAYTPEVNPKHIIKAIVEQIEKIVAYGVTNKELEKVRNLSLSNRIMDLFSTEHLCQRIGYAECVEGDWRKWVEKLEVLKLLKPEQLMDAAKQYWSDAHRFTLILKPKKLNPLLLIAGIARRLMLKIQKKKSKDTE